MIDIILLFIAPLNFMVGGACAIRWFATRDRQIGLTGVANVICGISCLGISLT